MARTEVCTVRLKVSADCDICTTLLLEEEFFSKHYYLIFVLIYELRWYMNRNKHFISNRFIFDVNGYHSTLIRDVLST